MTFRRLLLVSLLLTFAACSRHTEAPAATANNAAALASAASSRPLQDSEYVVIADGKPYDPVAGKTELVEFFNYICPACNAFEVLFEPWKEKLPADVNVVYVPADFNPDFALYARAYYAADLLGLVAKTHHAVYQAIHVSHQLPGEGQSPDAQRIAAFYEQFGVTAKSFADAMDSFAVNTRMDQGHQFMKQSQLGGTPTLIVNGKYLVKGRDYFDELRIAGQLIERERSATHPAQDDAAAKHNASGGAAP